MQNKNDITNFFSEFSDKSACINSGMCSVDPSSSALEELLLNEIRQIAFYIVKLSDFKIENKAIAQDAIKGLSVIIINTALKLKDYKTLLFTLEEEKKSAKSLYLNCCKEKMIKYELVENAIEIPKNADLTGFLKTGESLVVEKQKMYEPKKLDLIELIITFAKTSAINIEKLRRLGYVNDEWNFKILKFLNLTNISTIKIEKLKKKICEFSEVSYKIWEKLTETLEKHYGKRVETEINLEIKEGRSILVSGSDLDELDRLLAAAKRYDINIYTNSTLFMAFAYPHFLKYKNLIGHFGGENAEEDFTKFKGPIFATQSFLQKMDYFRRGTIFTTKIIAPEKIVRIENYDFEPLIQNALNSEGFNKEDAKTIEKVRLKYNPHEIDKIIESAGEKELCVIVGSYKKEKIIERFTGKFIIELESPIEIQLLIHILKKANCNNLSIVFTHCGPNTINILFSTLYFDPKKIYFAKCPHSLISPHVIRAMSEDFDVEMI